MRSRKGFTFIEILVVVAIIAILATAIMVSIIESRRKARINGTITSLRSTLPIIVSCNDYPLQKVGRPENGDKQICPVKSPDSLWPELPAGYAYLGEDYDGDCEFTISTNGDRATDIVCDCVKQTCQ